MKADGGAEMFGKHLRAQADAEIGLALAQGDCQPVDLLADVVVRIVGAHRAAEDDDAGMVVERFGKRVADARAADVEPVAIGAQPPADIAGIGFGAMNDDQHIVRRGAANVHCRGSSALQTPIGGQINDGHEKGPNIAV